MVGYRALLALLAFAIVASCGCAMATDGSIVKSANGGFVLNAPENIILQTEKGPMGESPDQVKITVTDANGDHELSSRSLTRTGELTFKMNVPGAATKIRIQVSECNGNNKFQLEWKQ